MQVIGEDVLHFGLWFGVGEEVLNAVFVGVGKVIEAVEVCRGGLDSCPHVGHDGVVDPVL